MRTLLWFRGKDLRLNDHQPLRDAAAAGEVIPLFVLDPCLFAPARAREIPHHMQFLLESLRELSAGIARLGSRLLVVPGRSAEIVPRLAAEWKVDRVATQRWVEPFARELDRRIADALVVPLDLFEGETLNRPGTLRNGAGKPYSVFTHFARAFAREVSVGEPLPAPRTLPPIPRGFSAETVPIPDLRSLGIEPNANLLRGGERSAHARLRTFLDGPAAEYDTGRNRLDHAGTSRLSADLKFGTVSPRAVWTAVESVLGDRPSARSFLNEMVWREFAHSTLQDRPELLAEPFRREFAGFPWRNDETLWDAWVEGRTGYPIVDAAARQLLGEGFVHNRARMIAASFLTKHLLIDYRLGEAHYMKYLVDGDPAQNNAGWQWSAGCGCDAQPWFRIFNPVTQGEKFDPEGAYVRTWVPELANVPSKWIHHPWDAPPLVLFEAGVHPGVDYPLPVVDHREARERFLAVAKRHLHAAAD